MQTQPSLRYGAVCRETNLVVQLARTFLSGANGCLQEVLAQPLDWAAVERTADFHSMMPLVAYALKQYGEDSVPPEIRERLQQRWLLTARNNLVRLQEWRRILNAFQSANVAVISVKGPALALLAYRNAALREFLDLDLLVRPGDMPAARDILVHEGYRLRFPMPGNADAVLLHSRNRQVDFVHDVPGFLVDLHWGALHEMFSFQLPVDQLFEAAQVEHHEAASFLRLSPEHMLLYLCAHGTKHCWLNLQWLCDVACHVQTAQELNWESCIHWAEAANCGLVLRHSLLLAQEVLGLDLPSSISNDCDTAKTRTLAGTASSFLFREDGNFRHLEALRYHLAFARGWRDRATLVFERIFVPAESDWQEVRLPQPLHLLYYAVRPVRFILNHLFRQIRSLEWKLGL